MTNRFPLIIDTQDGNKLKELPSGDNLDLDGSAIVNAASIQTAGNLSALSLTVNGESLSAVAFSNNYEDLDNVPILFSGQYVDLAGKPFIPSKTFQLDDVEHTVPSDGDGLVYNASTESYVPQPVLTEIDLSSQSLGDLGDTVITGIVTNRYLKFTAGAWRPSTVTWNDVTNKPTGVSAFQNDAGYITTADITDGTLTVDVNNTGDLSGSVFSDDSTLLVDGVNGTVPGTLTGSWINPENSFSVVGEGLSVSTQNTSLLVSNNGIAYSNSNNDDSVSMNISTSGITVSNVSNSNTLAISVAGGGVSLAGSGSFSASVSNNFSVVSGGFICATGAGNFDVATQIFNLSASNISIASDGITADLKGSVFADDSTLIIDGVNGEIPDYVKKQDLIDIVQASTDFDDFKTKIQDLL